MKKINKHSNYDYGSYRNKRKSNKDVINKIPWYIKKSNKENSYKIQKNYSDNSYGPNIIDKLDQPFTFPDGGTRYKKSDIKCKDIISITDVFDNFISEYFSAVPKSKYSVTIVPL